MEIKLDRKKNHIAASDYKEQTTVIKTTSDFKIGNNVDTNKIEGNYMVKREKETLIKIIELRKSRHYKIFCVNGNTGFRNESRIFYFIHLQNEEAYERKESSSA